MPIQLSSTQSEFNLLLVMKFIQNKLEEGKCRSKEGKVKIKRKQKVAKESIYLAFLPTANSITLDIFSFFAESSNRGMNVYQTIRFSIP